jgi:hypothetical protein
LIGLVAVGSLFLPAVYVSTPWLNWADYPLSSIARRRAGHMDSATSEAEEWIRTSSYTSGLWTAFSSRCVLVLIAANLS